MMRDDGNERASTFVKNILEEQLNGISKLNDAVEKIERDMGIIIDGLQKSRMDTGSSRGAGATYAASPPPLASGAISAQRRNEPRGYLALTPGSAVRS